MPICITACYHPKLYAQGVPLFQIRTAAGLHSAPADRYPDRVIYYRHVAIGANLMTDARDVEQLATVVALSQKLCVQTDIDGVIRTFMNGVVAISRSRRVRLVRREMDAFIVEYDARLTDAGLTVQPGAPLGTSDDLPTHALRAVLNTKSLVLL